MSARRQNFGKDTGLQARMLLTLFLLGLVYAIFIGVLFAAGAGAGVIIVIAVVLLLVQLFASDKLAMATLG
ncbi:MAG: heat shock protein HtpX, partial [Solirubrobacteraceae bacterium]|nr:heat shock protein HtpX [Solirubrobacteraceae bacterium]